MCEKQQEQFNEFVADNGLQVCTENEQGQVVCFLRGVEVLRGGAVSLPAFGIGADKPAALASLAATISSHTLLLLEARSALTAPFFG